MKKVFFVLLSFALCILIASCGTDGCSVEGNWKVSTVNITSGTFTESLIKIMEDEYLNTTFAFNADGTMSMISSGATNQGTYTVDKAANQLKWTDNQQQIENILDISNCSAGAVELVHRMPADSSQPEVATVSMTLVPN